MTGILLDPKRITDPELQMQWQGLLTRVGLSLNKLKHLANMPDESPDRPRFVDAVNEFHRVREEERAFFYQNFFREK